MEKLKILFFTSVVFIIVVIILTFVFRFDLLVISRESYLEYEFPDNQKTWAKSLKEIALEISSNCLENLDKCKIEEMRIFQTSTNRAIIIVQEKYLIGDSVEASQSRIELLRIGETWKVEWAGERWLCRPFRGNSSWWTTEICP